MKDLQFTIVSEDMVWIWYYDEWKGKHLKELLGKQAKEFITQQLINTSS